MKPFFQYYRHTALKEYERDGRLLQKGYRFAGSVVAYGLRNSIVRPNHLTVLNLFLAVIANALIAVEPFSGAIWAALVIHQCGIVFDHADGGLARLQDRTTKFGCWLDALVDRFSDVCLVLATCWNGHAAAAGWRVWPLGCVLVGALYLASTAGYTYQQLCDHTHAGSIGAVLKKRMVLLREFHFMSFHLYIFLPLAIIFQRVQLGLLLMLLWVLTSLLYSLVTSAISLRKQDAKTCGPSS